jgi:hypothetical protein
VFLELYFRKETKLRKEYIVVTTLFGNNLRRVIFLLVVGVFVSMGGVFVSMVGALADPPVNDECDSAVVVTPGVASSGQTFNIEATFAPDDPELSCVLGPGFGSVFFEFVAAYTSARIRTDLNSVGLDSDFAVYEVDQINYCDKALWTEVGCSEDGEFEFNGDICIEGLTVGHIYKIMLVSFTEGSSGDYTLQIDSPCPGAAGDADGDGVDVVDDSDDTNPNICRDVDNDTCDDCTNGTDDPNNDGPDNDGDGLCDAGDPDDDNDGELDEADNCPLVANADQTDTDEDGLGDACDPDDDNDGVDDADDSEPLNPNVCRDVDGDGCDDCSSGTDDPLNDGTDTDGDGLCDAGDTDDDNDGCIDADDPAPLVFSPDTDGDGVANDCDIDDDNDGVDDGSDSDPLDPNICRDVDNDGCDDCTSGTDDPANDGPDNDGDGICDDSDLCQGNDATGDSDGDGVCGDVDNCPDVANPGQEDTDQDGIGDVCDNCPNVSNPGQEDANGNGIGDACDYDDSDGDGVEDINDNCPDTPQWVIDAGLIDSSGCVDCLVLEAYIDVQCPPDADWKNHGKYVSCVSGIVGVLEDSGQISEECAGSINSARARSDVGKPQKGK